MGSHARQQRTGLADALRQHPHQNGIIVHPGRKCIYMKPAKTGGTSVFRHVLEPSIQGFVHNKAAPDAFAAWLSRITDAELCEYYIFATIRHPWDRFISLAGHFRISPAKCLKSFHQLVAENEDFRHHAVALSEYTHLNGACFADRLVRVENMQDDMDLVFAELDLPRAEIPLENRNTDTRRRTELTPAQKRKLAQLYPEDVTLYGYISDSEAANLAKSGWIGAWLHRNTKPSAMRGKEL